MTVEGAVYLLLAVAFPALLLFASREAPGILFGNPLQITLSDHQAAVAGPCKIGSAPDLSLLSMDPFALLEDSQSLQPMLAQISLFGGISASQQKEIFAHPEIGLLHQDRYVFHQGDEPSHIYIARSGAIKLVLPDAQLVIEKKLGVGECFGYVALRWRACTSWSSPA